MEPWESIAKQDARKLRGKLSVAVSGAHARRGVLRLAATDLKRDGGAH